MVFFLVLVPPRAKADELLHYQVEFSVDPKLPACDRGQEFAALLNNQFSKPILEPPASRTLRVRMGRTKAGDHAVDMQIEELDGRVVDTVHREFPASTCCFEVLYNAALLASVHILHEGKAATVVEPPPPPASCPAPPPPSQAPPPPPATPAAPPLPASAGLADVPPRFEVSAGPILATGMAPEIVPGVQLGAAVRLRGSWWFEGDARVTPWFETRPLGLTAFEVLTASGTAALCYRPGRFTVCGLVIGGARLTEDVDSAYPQLNRTGFAGVGGRVGMQQHLGGPFSIRADLDVAATLPRSQINTSNRPAVWETPWATVITGARLVTSFK
ncbi:hypothetical protein [Polyangium jinanense]|uniref:Uncharacterized protein n=1 Tax=Polyangium jinanense TaxID=2829994 RepID=A0A9X3XHC5_9BACT|nr:hypothetical protein [Polyangium jinanense]MDC3958178.1 hypothetical protein [Polyangium jinanense]MDC3988136.1 hypothetical protein [Polyangium jinanense]